MTSILKGTSSADDTSGNFYYRVDSAINLRKLSGETEFRPKRWDTTDNAWPHRSLLAAKAALRHSHGIFRISFWQSHVPAERDLRSREVYEPHLMLRIARSAVIRAFNGWAIEEDDFLPGEADLIWTAQATDSDSSSLFNAQGVPLHNFEVWNDERLRWEPWRLADALAPDCVRLGATGWQPIGLNTRQGGPVLAYWKITPPRPSVSIGPACWLLMMLDENSRGTLGSEAEAITEAVILLANGPLGALQPSQFGVLTVHATRDRIWTEQYKVAWESVLPDHLLARVWRQLRGQPSQRLRATLHHFISLSDEIELFRISHLPLTKREISDSTWARHPG